MEFSVEFRILVFLVKRSTFILKLRRISRFKKVKTNLINCHNFKKKCAIELNFCSNALVRNGGLLILIKVCYAAMNEKNNTNNS